MSNQGTNALEAFTSSVLNAESSSDSFLRNCPYGHSEHIKTSYRYQTQNNGERTIYLCQDCESSYSETYGTPIAGLATPLSEIIKVLKARMEGLGLNATNRVFGFAKNTILNWERRLSSLEETLFLYALVHESLQLVIEGDELYTKVNKNTEASQSEGWTIVLMEQASRFFVAALIPMPKTSLVSSES